MKDRGRIACRGLKGIVQMRLYASRTSRMLLVNHFSMTFLDGHSRKISRRLLHIRRPRRRPLKLAIPCLLCLIKPQGYTHQLCTNRFLRFFTSDFIGLSTSLPCSGSIRPVLEACASAYFCGYCCEGLQLRLRRQTRPNQIRADDL